MTWNYRVMSYGEDNGYGIHEVYYDEDGNVDGWTMEPMVTGDNVNELLDTLSMVAKDVIRSRDNILDYNDKALAKARMIATHKEETEDACDQGS